MVTMFGMSEKLGPMAYAKRYENLSGTSKANIESEVQKTLSDSYERAKVLLLSKRKELDLLAQALVEYETLDSNEVAKVIAGEKLENRIKVPIGPMKVPKPVANIDIPVGIPGANGSGDGGARPPPPPPPAPPAAA